MNKASKEIPEAAEIIDFEDYIKNIDQEKVDEYFNESSKGAEELLNDEDKMEKFLQKLEKKFKAIPSVGNALAYMPIMISLVRSYVKKDYTELPITSIISIIVALAYFLSPVDLIPDVVPGAGYVDDALIISACVALVKTDIDDYLIWRKEQGLVLEDIPEYNDIAKDAKEINKFAKVFFKKK